MLTALTLLALATGPSSRSAPPRRIEICGLPVTSKPRLRILPRTGPAFSGFVGAPAALEEPRARSRSFAVVPCSPALCDDGGAFARPHPFKRYPRHRRGR